MQERAGALAGILLAVWALLAGASAWSVWGPEPGVFLTSHEGDAIHLADIVLRQAMGQWPHLDFMTPIGVLATWPIAIFVGAGWGLGPAILLSQIALGAVLLPALWWVGRSRMGWIWGAIFGAICLVLTLALIHGESQSSLSISMHYNRWAWAIAFVVLALAIVPPKGACGPMVDGVILGLGLAALGLIKVTFLVACLPVVLAAIAMRREVVVLVVGVATGLVVLAVVTALAGMDFWAAYIGDLLEVRRSPIRSAPGASMAAVITDPAYIGGTLTAFAGVVLLRRAGREEAGALLLLALPGVFFVTYQNFGNDPQWLYLLGVLFFVLRTDAEAPNHGALGVAGVVAFALAAPSFFNLATSPFRHLNAAHATFAPLLPDTPEADGLMFRKARIETVIARQPVAGFGGTGQRAAQVGTETLTECQLDSGTIAVYSAIAERLGPVKRPLMTADLFNAMWLFVPDMPPLKGGAPWHYGGLPGIAEAELLLVPTCPVLPKVRRLILADLAARQIGLTEIARDDLYRLYTLQRPK